MPGREIDKVHSARHLEPDVTLIPDNDAGLTTLKDVYAVLGVNPDEHVSVCNKTPDGRWLTKIHQAGNGVDAAQQLSGDVYFGLNPHNLPVGANAHRGTEGQITRLVGLPADLDIKDGACRDLPTAHAIIGDVSSALGTRPRLIISSGRGIQPVWTVTDCDASQGRSLLRRFGRLVAACAFNRDVKVDNIFDLPRVLRVPGTLNHKYDPPLATSAVQDSGRPLTAMEVDQRLTAAGIREQANDSNLVDSVVVSEPRSWTHRDNLCGYAKTTVNQWKTDDPASGRHQMLLSNLVRLACMWRFGCLTGRKAVKSGIKHVAQRHQELCNSTQPRRHVSRYEIEAAWIWALERVSAMTDEQVAAQLGDHDHNGNSTSPVGWLSDANVSQLLVDRVLKDRYHWTKAMGWLRWDGKRWRPTPDEDVVEQSRLFARQLLADQIAAGATPEVIRAYTKRLSSGSISAAASLARGQLQTDASNFDAQPDYINVANGVVELWTGRVIPHDPSLLFTWCAPTAYEPKATHPDWETALEALPEDRRQYMQHRLGQGITGHPTPDDVMPLVQGGGANGKSTLTTGILKALGEFVTVVPERLLLGNPNDHPTEMMPLRGARLAILEETPEARRLNVKRLKDVLGTTMMTGRYSHKDNVTWTATHSLFVFTNYRPTVEETDHGTWRRLSLIVFPYTYRRDHEKLTGKLDRRGDATLRERISSGANGQHEAVLRWLVDGAVQWYRNGKVMQQPPESVREATYQWRLEADLVLRFKTENLVVDENCYVTGQDMHAVFTEWLKGNGHRGWSTQTFAERFGKHDSVTSAGIFTGRVYTATTKLTASRPKYRTDETVPELPKKPQAWTGVRFRTAADDDEAQGDTDGTQMAEQDSSTGATQW
jgi:putative DNA primase/helicase